MRSDVLRGGRPAALDRGAAPDTHIPPVAFDRPADRAARSAARNPGDPQRTRWRCRGQIVWLAGAALMVVALWSPSWPSVHAQEEPQVSAAATRPLPDPDAFLAEVRDHLETDRTLQSSYAYVETRREMKLDDEGRVVDESVKVFENYPGLPGEDRWERLISEDGVPVPAETLAKQDRERQKRAQEIARRMAREPRKEHERQVRAWEEHRRDTSEAVDDIFRVFDIRMLRREPIDGHDTIVFDLTPREDAKPRTREGEMMRHFTVRAWVSEQDHELVRLHAEAIDTVKIGFGLLARIHEGARFSFERKKVNGEVWLPAETHYSGSARVALFRVVRRAGSSEFSDYRKFTVDTSTTYSGLRASD